MPAAVTIDCPVVLRAPQLPVGGSAWFDVALRVLEHGWRGGWRGAGQVAIGLNHLGHNLAIAGALATAAELGPTPPAADDCPGEGRCHGCASWCDRCGDVTAVCHSGSCERHHCSDCRADVTSSEEIVEGAGWCTACQEAAKAP